MEKSNAPQNPAVKTIGVQATGPPVHAASRYTHIWRGANAVDDVEPVLSADVVAVVVVVVVDVVVVGIELIIATLMILLRASDAQPFLLA